MSSRMAIRSLIISALKNLIRFRLGEIGFHESRFQRLQGVIEFQLQLIDGMRAGLIVDGDTLREAVEAAQLIDGRRWYEHLAVFLKRLTVDLTPDVLL